MTLFSLQKRKSNSTVGVATPAGEYRMRTLPQSQRAPRLLHSELFDNFSLEERQLLSTITRTSGDIFYVDAAKPYNGQYLTSAYVSYEFLNTDGKAYNNVYAKISNFTGGQISLGASASDTYQVGAVADGANDTAFFYLSSKVLTTNTVPQSHTVTFFDGPPSDNKPIVSQSFTINAQYDLIAAAANKITGATLTPANPVLGDTITVTLQGQTGTIGTGYNASYAMYYTPAAFGNFPAGSLKLESTKLVFSGGLTGTYTDDLLVPKADVQANTGSADYVATYTFKAVGTTSAPTALSPIAYIASGTQVKHNDINGLPLIPIISGNAPTIDTTGIPNWTINQPYNQALTTTGGTGPYTYAPIAGSLAPGMVLNPNGTITGTPTSTGTYTFTAQVTDANGIVSTKEFTYTINGTPTIASPTTFTAGTLNQAYPNTPITVTGGTPGYSNYTVSAGALPTGLTLDPVTGVVSGTPTAAGTFSFTVQVTDAAGAVATKVYNAFIINATQAPTITSPTTLPNWTVGQPYPNQQVQLTGGTGPYSNYQVSAGSLPSGLTLDPITGLISGTPTATGTFTVTLQAQDSLGAIANKPYTFTVNSAPVINSPANLPAWTVGQLYPAQTVTLTGGTPGYSNFNISAGNLPNGMSINPTTGVISGTPTSSGTYPITVSAQDSTGAIASKPYSLVINAAPVISSPTVLPNWTVNQPYPSQQIVVTAGTPGYSNYTISAGNLPAGLALDPVTGVLSGTPTATGNFSVTVSALDSTGAEATKPYTFTINVAPSIAGPNSLPNWTVGQPYPATPIVPQGGTPGYSNFQIVGGSLPDGMTLDPVTGVISGTPTVPGPVNIVVQVQDSTGAKTSTPYNFVVNGAPIITSPTSLPNWTVNQAYPSTPVVMTGGTPGYSNFVVSTGSLPAGMTLNNATGVISGTPTTTGSYTLQVQGQDSTGAKATYPYTFTINAAPVITAPTSLPNWTVNQPYPNQQVTLANGTPGYSNYTLASGTLPAGLTLNNSTGLISGTPTVSGNFNITVQAQDTTGALATKPYSFTINVSPSIAGPNSLPNWTVGQPYPSTPIVPQGGTPGYSNFQIVGGTLPAGMTLDPVTGVISGTPTVAGPVSIVVQVQDSTGAKTSTPYNFVVNSLPVITSPTSLQDWTVNQPYPSKTVTMSGGTPGYSNFVVSTGSLPAGMSLNPVTGVISGTPTNTGNYTLNIQGQDSTGAKANYPYTFTINAAPVITAPASLPNWTVNQPYPNQQVTLTGGTPGYSNYNVATGTLPAGLTLNPTTGLISGTPTTTGNFSILVQAQDTAGAVASRSYNFTINVRPSVAGPNSLPDWTVGQPYPVTPIVPQGGTPGYSNFQVVGGSLPAGMTLDPVTGVISGTPTVPGPVNIQVQVQDSTGATTTTPYTFVVNGLPLIVSPNSLPNWTVNQPYPTKTVVMSGGTPGYSNFVVSTGTLPAGLTLNPTTGVISGTPTSIGNYTLQIQGQDSTGAKASYPYSLTINAAPVITGPASLPTWTVGEPYPNQQVTLANGTPGYSNYVVSVGSLPAGLSLDPTTGQLTGTPTTTGTFNITVQAQDSTGVVASKPYSFTVNVRPSIAGPGSLPNWTVGQPYPVTPIVPQGGTPGYSNFQIVGGSLPAGMTLDPVTGVISGTPTVPGPVNIQVQAQDATGAKMTTPYSFVVASKPVISSPTSLQDWTVSQPYPTKTVVMTGGTPGYSNFIVATGALPAGLSLDPVTGVISGTPTNTGSYTLQIQGQDSTGSIATYPYSFVINATPVITGPASLPTWTVGEPYPSQQVTLANGTPGYSNYVVAVGSLPAGLSLDPNTGQLTGTPTTTGTFNITVAAQDSTGVVASKPYSFTVNVRPSFAGPGSLPNWTVGEPYPTTPIVPQGGTPGYSNFQIVGGSLPPGMTLDPVTGVISGTPLVPGPVNIQVQAQDATGAKMTTPYSFVIASQPVIASPTSLQDWTVNQPYPTKTVVMSGGTPGYSNFIVATGALPAGLSLNPTTGVISGTPTNTGNYTLQIQGQDSTGSKATYPYSFVINAAPVITGPASLPTWTVGEPYPNQQVTLASGTPGYSNYNVAVGSLPAGLTLDPNTGLISGTPTATGNFTVTVQAQDSTGVVASKAYSFSINVRPTVSGPGSLPNWTVGQPYPPQTIVPQGGTPGYSNFKIVGGSLPPGMSLDPVTGVISGTPTVPGPVNIQVQAQDATGATFSTPYSFNINSLPAITGPASLQDWTVGQAYPTKTVTMGSGTPGYSGFTVIAGAIPVGMSLNPITGELSGTPSQTGLFSPVIQGQDSAGVKAIKSYNFVINAAPVLTAPASLPNWTVGELYPLQQIILQQGTPGYSNYKLSFGALPTGLTIDQNSGILSGTPSQTGQFSIVVQAQDTTGATASKLYSFAINVRPTIAGPNALPNWTVGQPYPPQTIQPQGGTPGYSNFKIVGGALPAGMTLDPVTGVISGTPTVAGPVSIQVQVQDAAGATVTTPYNFVVNSRPEIVQPQALQNWTVGQPYPNTQVVLVNGTPGYSNYVVAAGALPAGMSLNQTTGLIAGTPLQTGPFSLIIQAQDSTGAVASHSYLFTINVRPSIAGPSSLPNWTVGQPYPPQTIVPQGGTPGYSNFRIAGGQLPAGLTLDPNTGIISGTPTVSGPVSIVVEGQDSTGATFSTPYSFTINPLAQVVITSETGGKATVGEPYRGQVSVPTGGTGPFTYAITSGQLPAGVTLDPKTGVISGTPTGGQAGPYPFTVTVTDAAGAKSSANSVIDLGYFSIQGVVYYDINHNKILDTADYGIVNVLMTLTGKTAAGVPVNVTTTTDADGFYNFGNLYPGQYSLTRANLKGVFRPEVVNPGTLGGTPAANKLGLSGISLSGQAVDDVMNNFGNLQMPNCKLRHISLYTGNLYQDVLARRAANPAQFDANHPGMVSALNAGQIPWGVKPFPNRPNYSLSYVPNLGTKNYVYGQPVAKTGAAGQAQTARLKTSQFVASKSATKQVKN